MNPNSPCPFSVRSFYVHYVWRMVTFCLDLLPSPHVLMKCTIFSNNIFNIYRHSVCIFAHNRDVHPRCHRDCVLGDSQGLLLLHRGCGTMHKFEHWPHHNAFHNVVLVERLPQSKPHIGHIFGQMPR